MPWRGWPALGAVTEPLSAEVARSAGWRDAFGWDANRSECGEGLPEGPAAAWAVWDEAWARAQSLIDGSPRTTSWWCWYLPPLAELLESPEAASVCPRRAAWRALEAALALEAVGQPRRGRLALEFGGVFSLMGLTRAILGKEKREAVRAEITQLTRLYAQFSAASLGAFEDTEHQPLLRAAPATARIVSLCTDPAQRALARRNHEAYAARHGYSYEMHTESVIPDEPQRSKLPLLLSALQHDGEWALWIDCDAYFSAPEKTIGHVLEAAATERTELVIAEDPAGINTGVLLARASAWSRAFFAEAMESGLITVWDQSQLLHTLVRRAGLRDCSLEDADPPAEIARVPQSVLNAYHSGTAESWRAYAWQPGDFVLHFAGCPYIEDECREKMEAHVALIEKDFIRDEDHG